jgi:hypothetical protein
VLLTGIIVTAVSVILMIVGLFTAAAGAGTNSDKTFISGFAIYGICIFGYVTGLTLVALGIAQNLGWI